MQKKNFVSILLYVIMIRKDFKLLTKIQKCEKKKNIQLHRNPHSTYEL